MDRAVADGAPIEGKGCRSRRIRGAGEAVIREVKPKRVEAADEQALGGVAGGIRDGDHAP